ncbi:MAG: hypothetical protein ACOC71_08460 [Hyphomicrobiales bacterium]
MNQAERHEKRARKARRDLDRMGEQSEKIFGAGSSDPPEHTEDRIEILGRRIGRSLGYVIGTGLLIYLLATYVFV